MLSKKGKRVGERLAELLVENGVEYVFGVPGGQTLPLYEGISKYKGRIQHVLMRDERSAGYAADTFARVTGRVCNRVAPDYFFYSIVLHRYFQNNKLKMALSLHFLRCKRSV